MARRSVKRILKSRKKEIKGIALVGQDVKAKIFRLKPRTHGIIIISRYLKTCNKLYFLPDALHILFPFLTPTLQSRHYALYYKIRKPMIRETVSPKAMQMAKGDAGL